VSQDLTDAEWLRNCAWLRQLDRVREQLRRIGRGRKPWRLIQPYQDLEKQETSHG
jgi:hypothetical protein